MHDYKLTSGRAAALFAAVFAAVLALFFLGPVTARYLLGERAAATFAVEPVRILAALIVAAGLVYRERTQPSATPGSAALKGLLLALIVVTSLFLFHDGLERWLMRSVVVMLALPSLLVLTHLMHRALQRSGPQSPGVH